MSHEQYMRAAIEMAHENPAAPFGAVLVDHRTGDIICRGRNRSRENPLYHGEMDVIHRHVQAGGGDWGCLSLYSTAEPCSMCLGAILWCGISRVVFGTSIRTLQRLGWKQIDISASEIVQRSFRPEVRVEGAVLEGACDALFAQAVSRWDH